MEQLNLTVTDMHTAGEPVRIVTGGYPELQGNTILEKRRDAEQNHDHIRRLLMLEPRGHKDMYGVIPVEPSHPDADLAVLFMHCSGYSTMCGHATIAIGRWALDEGLVEVTEPETRFVLECPCGLVYVTTQVENGVIGQTSFESVRGYAHSLDQKIELDGLGNVTYDISYGGAYYAFIAAQELGLDLDKSDLSEVRARATLLTDTIRTQVKIESPDASDLGFLYGTIVTENDGVKPSECNNHLCFFAEAQLDRSPTGSGVTARLALAHAKGQVGLKEKVSFSGVSGVAFDGEIIRSAEENGTSGVITEICGRGYYAGKSTYHVENDDPLYDGFLEPTKPSQNWT
ncbi:proline racemase family protein [Kordiimonas sp. SCSIO 12610]|uniref:proline racemase family protein n=1 Tax=Kordiimonas sp. SCSIO 12610 TaxID=2829597 RepID=UPI00210BA97F|nr:proline racemase family protein [Kordiimonas sp. SCSIO 12610]UTW54349.1 proline racemase family protein [Kordiimonas sp. SCSIO 12610]